MMQRFPSLHVSNATHRSRKSRRLAAHRLKGLLVVKIVKNVIKVYFNDSWSADSGLELIFRVTEPENPNAFWHCSQTPVKSRMMNQL